MEQRILIIMTRTPLHIGAGSSVGSIDQPILRERHTGFPVIPGSSLKGVLRERFERADDAALVTEWFGGDTTEEDGGKKTLKAGNLSFGEGRMVAFPVRSAKGAFALVVSPLTLSRLQRDAGWNDLQLPASPDEGKCLADDPLTFKDKDAIVLEEYRFAREGAFPAEWKERLAGLLADPVLKAAAGHFVLLNDGDLSHFAINACQVNQHVRIDSETGTSKDGGLFNEETVPAEALFYASMTQSERRKGEPNPVYAQLAQPSLLQLGGKETTGLGFCSIQLLEA